MNKFMEKYGTFFGYFVNFDGVKYLVKQDENGVSYFVPVCEDI